MDINNETTQAIIGGVSFSLVTLFLFVIFLKRQPGQGSWLLQTAKALGIFGFLFGLMLLFALLAFLNNPQFFLQPLMGESLQPKHYLFIIIIGILGPWLAQYIITSIKRKKSKNQTVLPKDWINNK